MDETTKYPLSIEPQGLVYQDRTQKVYRIIAQFDGFSKEYYVSDHGQRAAVVVVRNGSVLFVRQYRLVINRLSYEIPGGKVEEEEAPIAAAVRECLEETGIRCLSLKPLINYQISLDTTKNYTHIFYTDQIEDCTQDNLERRVWIPIARCIDLIHTEDISDSLSIIALLAYHTLVNGS